MPFPMNVLAYTSLALRVWHHDDFAYKTIRELKEESCIEAGPFTLIDSDHECFDFELLTLDTNTGIMSDNSRGVLMFILGAAAGVAVGYFLAAENKQEIICDIKEKVSKATETIEEEIEKGKKLVGELKKKANDLLEEPEVS